METILRLFRVIQRLRGENGCEWDQKQTPLSMWKCLIEEVYELEEAVVKNDLENICEELGDVLFQLLFLLEIFQERQVFTLSDVVDGVEEKMIRRHPHVYGDAKISTPRELNRQWETIKADEKKKNGQKRPSVLDAVPKGMPSLIRAMKVSKCAVKEGFEWDNIGEVMDTVKEEIQEFESALQSGNKDEQMMEFGDILFTLVNVARVAGFHPETALSASTAKFEDRFRLMEGKLKKKKLELKHLSRDRIDQLWEEVKEDQKN